MEGEKKILCTALCDILDLQSLFTKDGCIILHFAFSLAFMRMDNDSLDNICYEMKGCAKRRGPGYELFSEFHKDESLGNLVSH